MVPSGTVTFLFSDVVGSTRLWAKQPAAMSVALRVHDQVIREAVAAHDGYVFATAGDGYSVAFDRATSAIDCATAIQAVLATHEWGSGPALTVRIGLHLGQAEEREGNFFGPTVNLTARVAAAAHGCQCVMTEAVRDAAAVVASDLGMHFLRDIDAPVHLYQIGDDTFPPLWSLGNGIVSLPAQRTPLIGRADDVIAVRRLLADARLVTLTGVGGCGKTRLAVEVAHDEVSANPGGVWFVDLAAIADDAAVGGAFATALDLAVDRSVDVARQIAAYLAPRKAVLVVDNCEHVIDCVAQLLDELLEGCPRLQVLATSRESLEIAGEHTWKVPSLATGAGSAAVELFMSRATAAGANLVRDEESMAIVGDIVEQLDGIPLAIELAAARARSVDLEELRDRLDDRFRFLSGGKRRSRQRQATLEAAMQWSYDLLDDGETSMLRCLSVFQGGFALADVAAVAGVDENVAIDLVDALAAKSLIDVLRDSRGQLRYQLLETIRLFALSRLIETDEIAEVRDRHLDHFVNDSIGASWNDRLDIRSMLRIDREFDNLRSAATWALERGRPDATVRLAAAAADAFVSRGERQLALEWLQLPADLHGRQLVFARAVLAYFLQSNGDIESACRAAREAIAEGERSSCDDVVAAMLVLNSSESVRGNHDLAQELLSAARIAARSFGANARAMTELAWLESCIERGTTEEALAVAIDICDHAPTLGWRYWVEATRASLLLMLDRIAEAAEVVGSFSEVPPTSQWGHMMDVTRHAVMVHTDGPDVAARSLAAVARESVARRPELCVDFLQCFAYAAYFGGDHERAREMSFNTLPVGAGWIQAWLVGQLYGTTSDDSVQIRREFDAEHPWNELRAFTEEHGARLFVEELARWS